MKRARIAFAVLATLSLPIAAQAQDDRQPSRPAIAVVAFDTSRTGWMPPPGFGETVAEMLTDRLMAAGAFRIIDSSIVAVPGDAGRTPVPVLMDRASGAGVRYLVVGAVTRLSMEQRTSSGGALLPIPIIGGLMRKQKTDSIIGLTIRVIDVRTGEVVTAASVQGDASGNTSSGGGIGGFIHVPFAAGKRSSASGIQDGLLATAVGEAVASAAEQLSAAVTRLTRPAPLFVPLLFTNRP